MSLQSVTRLPDVRRAPRCSPLSMATWRRGALLVVAMGALGLLRDHLIDRLPVVAGEIVRAQFDTDLVPRPVEYAVLLPGPDDRAEAADAAPAGAPADAGDSSELPLLLFLHGGGASREFLTQVQPLVEAAWRSGVLPPVVVATPSAGRSLYMDYRDGSQHWETLLAGPFLEHVAQSHGASLDPARTLIAGVSMGGQGALRLAFKQPQRFAAVAAVEPAIMPALALEDVPRKNLFFQRPELLETIYGQPIDAEYWAANNPATIAQQQIDRLRESKLAIYLECGDEDVLRLHHGAEFLHRLLWDHQVPHEYHLVRGADHLGHSLRDRVAEALAFLGRVLVPPPREPELERFRAAMRLLEMSEP